MMAQAGRPLSPHLQIYRWYLTMALSILHRVTGCALAVGTLLLVWWLTALASGPEAFATVQSILHSWFGVLVMIGFTAALFLHFANGVRHLVWDAGYGFDKVASQQSGVLVLAATAVLTVVTWLAVLMVG